MTDDMGLETKIDRLAVQTSDGLDLRAEIAIPTDVQAAVVVCHPHPLHGGSMYANVVEALLLALPEAGTAVLRFNFRGTSGSEGRHDYGQGEQLDVLAALDEIERRWPEVPLALTGYSFGADMALAVDDARVSAWFAVAPPLRILPFDELVALGNARPKHLVAAAHDQFRPPTELTKLVAGCPNTSITTIDGADHFFAVGLPDVVAVAHSALSPSELQP